MTLLIVDSFKFATGGGGGATDPDAAAYIAAVEEADEDVLEAGVVTAIDEFVIGCKADGVWSAIKASCIMAGARTLDGALVPLVGTAPTRAGTEGGWNYDRATGLQGNGTNNNLNSQRANNADPQDDAHISVWLSSYGTIPSSTVVFSALIGAGTNSSAVRVLEFDLNQSIRNKVNNSAITLKTGASQTGFIGASRASSSSYTLRFDEGDTTVSQTSGTPISTNLNIFSRGNSQWSNARLGFYSIGESLNLALLDARVSTLMAEIATAIS